MPLVDWILLLLTTCYPVFDLESCILKHQKIKTHTVYIPQFCRVYIEEKKLQIRISESIKL